MTEPRWASRNIILKDYDIENKTVLDFGCGDKSICNYLSFKNYVGYDLNPLADYQIDFNKKFTIKHTAEVGLVLGVLEYLDDPNKFLKTIQPTCKRFIFMVLAIKGPKIRHGWKRVYNQDSFDQLLSNYFQNYKTSKINKYIIADCYNHKI